MLIERTASGKHRGIVRYAGQRRTTRSYPTEGEALMAAAELLLEMGGGGASTERDVTVESMLLAHLADMRPPDDNPDDPDRWSPGFHHDATAVVTRLRENHALFVQRRIRDVTPAVIHGLWRELDKAGWTRWRMRRLHTVMSTAWLMAVRLDWAETSPCPMAPPPTPRERDVVPATEDQIVAVLAEIDTPRKGRRLGPAGVDLDWLAVRLLATIGTRRGDVVAIRWDAVDLDKGEVLIKVSLAVTPGQVHEMSTKAGKRSHRRLALDGQTVARLKSWRARQRGEAFARGLPPPVWVFSDDAGVTPWRPDRPTRIFTRAARRVGVKPGKEVGGGVRLNDLRHYVATSMLDDGESVHDAAGQLGNTPATLEAKYRHWLPGRGRDGVTRRAGRLDRHDATG